MPGLPGRARIWLSSTQARLATLASFLAQTLAQPELLSNKATNCGKRVSTKFAVQALHLFLQTSLSTRHIQQNLDGSRDDGVGPGSPPLARRSSSDTEIKEKVEQVDDTSKRNRKSFIHHWKYVKAHNIDIGKLHMN